jgi:hypothetical protein
MQWRTGQQGGEVKSKTNDSFGPTSGGSVVADQAGVRIPT